MKLDRYIVFCIDYRCNNRCVICMLEGIKGKLSAVPLDDFKKLLKQQRSLHPEKRGIIFSGAEATLNDDLPRYVSRAKKAGYTTIMLQTNGRRLSDPKIAKSLMDAGINEFFVSIHAADKKTNALLTKKKDAFEETRRAISHLNNMKARIITNTVITRLNYRGLPLLADYFSGFRHIRESHFWDYLDLKHGKGVSLTASYGDSLPYLFKALKILKNNKKKIVLKYFPECLLGDGKKYLDNSQPAVTFGVQDLLWDKMKSCDFKKCEFCSYQRCQGLPRHHRVR